MLNLLENSINTSTGNYIRISHKQIYQTSAKTTQMNSSVKLKCLNKTIMLLTKHVQEELRDSGIAKSSNIHLRIIINTVERKKNPKNRAAKSSHWGWEDKQHEEY